MEIKERIAELEQRREQAKALFLKCEGAIEALMDLDSEKNQESIKKDIAKDENK